MTVHLLVVDDDSLVVEEVQRWLNQQSMEGSVQLFSADTAQAAVQMVHQASPLGLILCDLCLPGAADVEVPYILHQLAHCPIVAITATERDDIGPIPVYGKQRLGEVLTRYLLPLLSNQSETAEPPD